MPKKNPFTNDNVAYKDLTHKKEPLDKKELKILDLQESLSALTLTSVKNQIAIYDRVLRIEEDKFEEDDEYDLEEETQNGEDIAYSDQNEDENDLPFSITKADTQHDPLED